MSVLINVFHWTGLLLPSCTAAWRPGVKTTFSSLATHAEPASDTPSGATGSCLRNQKPLKLRTVTYTDPLALFLLALTKCLQLSVEHAATLPPLPQADCGMIQEGQQGSGEPMPEVLKASLPAWTPPLTESQDSSCPPRMERRRRPLWCCACIHSSRSPTPELYLGGSETPAEGQTSAHPAMQWPHDEGNMGPQNSCYRVGVLYPEHGGLTQVSLTREGHSVLFATIRGPWWLPSAPFLHICILNREVAIILRGPDAENTPERLPT